VSEKSLVCNLNVFTPQDRTRHDAVAHSVFTQVEATTELATGYAFRLPVHQLQAAAEFIALERLCCSFLEFGMQVSSDGVLWLSMTGPEGVKQLLSAEFGININVKG